MGWFTGIITLLGELGSLFSKLLDMWKTKSLQDQGRALQQADEAKAEIDINRKQTEILSQDRTKQDTISKMQDGSF